MAAVKWTQNDLGLWKTEDGEWGIFPESNGKFRLQVSTGPNPWEWRYVGYYNSLREAQSAAAQLRKGTYN